MPKRTKQQIQEDNAKLLKNKIKALNKLNAHLEQVEGLDEKDIQKINCFLNLFIKCEIVYKTLYPEMKKLKDEVQLDVRSLKFNVQWFEAALRYFGISYDHDKMNKMFCSRKSYLTCRDKILHGFEINSINEVLDNFDEMEATMKELLVNVSKGRPEI